ncbi:hypothetical protein GCM10022295_83270 [Streptomyces osmaniensis]|uniref:Transposase n=1 Tax=Streptomyces osmaniensis TaxID=593134 RepID=A0ABP6YWG1_9ACTN|nr:hypothetical protein KJK32_05120 [Streptomyces sp. JCM17656]
MPGNLLATALYGLGQYEAAAIEQRGDGLRPSTKVCETVTWPWENGNQDEATNLIGTVCAVLRGRPMPGGAGRIMQVTIPSSAPANRWIYCGCSRGAPLHESHPGRNHPRGGRGAARRRHGEGFTDASRGG